MKYRSRNFPAVLTTTLLISACASFHNGTISSGPLLSATDKHTKTASGSAETNVVLGFGGTATDALVYNAKAQMEKDYPLSAGEYYANYTVDFKRTLYFLIFLNTKVFVHADIVSQNAVTVPTANKGVDSDPDISFYKTKTDSFWVGEHIYLNYDGRNQTIYTFNEFEIKGFDKEGYAYLEFAEKAKDATVDKTLLYYSKDKARKGFRAGDEVVFSHKRKDVKGTVLATAPEQLLVSYDKGFYELKYTNVTKATQ